MFVRADKAASLPMIDLAATPARNKGLRLIGGAGRLDATTRRHAGAKGLEISGEARHPARSSGDRLDVAVLSSERIERELAAVALWG